MTKTDYEKKIAVAKAVCAACPVIMECRWYAMDTHQDHGVWGGLDERERRSRPWRRWFRALRDVGESDDG